MHCIEVAIMSCFCTCRAMLTVAWNMMEKNITKHDIAKFIKRAPIKIAIVLSFASSSTLT